MNNELFSNIYLISALISFLLMIYVLINSKKLVSRSLILLLLSVILWSLFYGIELRVINYDDLLIALKFQYLGIVTIPVFWLVFASRYSGNDHWVNAKNFFLLAVIPLMTLIMVFTNQQYALFYTKSIITPHELGFFHDFVPGFFYYVHIAYSYLLVFIGFIQIVLMFRSVSKDDKKRVLFILLSAFIPILFSLLYLFGFEIGFNVDLTPFGFMLMTLLLIFGAYKNKLLNFKPLILNALFESLPDAIFATDIHNNIVSSNPKAIELLRQGLISQEQIDSIIQSKSYYYNSTDNTYILEIKSSDRCFRIQKSEVKNKRGVRTGDIFMVVDVTMEKKYRDDLKKSEEQYRLLFDNAQEGILVVQNRKLVFLNPVIEKLTGYSHLELLSMSVDELIWKEDMAMVEKIYREFQEKQRFEAKNHIRLHVNKGRTYWIEFSLVPIEWHGKKAGLIFVNDIDEKKQTEELKALLIKISNSYINAPVSRFVETINETLREIGEFVCADRAYIFDYDWSNNVCNNTFEWCSEGIAPEIKNLQKIPLEVISQWVNTHKNNQPIFVGNVALLQEDDTLREILEPQGIKSLISIPMMDGNQCIGFVGFDSVKTLHKYSDQEKILLQVFSQMLVNFTNRKTDSELIERQISVQRLINDVSTELVSANTDNIDKKIAFVLSLTGNFFNTDRSYLLRYSDDISKENNTHEWCAESISSQKNSLKDVLLDQYPWWKSQIEKKKLINIPNVNLLPNEANLEKIEFERQEIKSLLCMPIVNNFRLIGFVGFDAVINPRTWTRNEIDVMSLIANILGDTLVRIDIENQLVRSKELAEAASVAKSNFLSNMSHEIRTPLNGVIGFTELLRNTNLTRTQHDYLDNAINAANSLLSVISDILDFSKIESGKLEIEKVKTDIIQLFENSSDIIKLHASTKGLELLLNIAPDTPRFAVVDPIRVKQILVNLLSNAVKFTHVGEIELSLDFKKINNKTGVFAVKVRDTGIGIKEEDKEKLFKAFSQADTSTTRRYGGTGLGLIISNSLAAKMNSKIKFESEFGNGATFYFDLRCDYEEGNLDSGLISNISSVLVVDDNPNNRMILEHTLTYKGLSFAGADCCDAALNILSRGECFDLIIVDYHMPDVDGLDTIRKIRTALNDVDKKQPVIMLHSSSDEIELHDKARELGVNFLLAKPVKQDELYSYLRGINKDHETTIQTENKQVVGDNLEIVDSSDYTIMVVEDTQMNMMVITKMIKNMLPDTKVIEATNGLEAIRLMKNEHLSLIMMDVQMPEMDGLEATIQIRKLKNGATVPIVALTAGVSKEEREHCFNAGMNDFLAKPIEKNELERIVNEYLK